MGGCIIGTSVIHKSGSLRSFFAAKLPECFWTNSPMQNRLTEARIGLKKASL